MQIGIGPHLDDADLEQYAMGQLPEERVAPFEEHFLACDSCQDRFLETDSFVNAVRTVSPKLRRERPLQWHDRFFGTGPRWVAAVVFGGLLLLMARNGIVAPGQPALPAAVVLYASRGIEGLAAAKAPAGKPMTLQAEVSQLPDLPSYRMEVVNATGTPVWQSEVTPRERQVKETLPQGLAAGQYFVRLYGGGALLREFGLRVE